jgi:hypothetical protein
MLALRPAHGRIHAHTCELARDVRSPPRRADFNRLRNRADRLRRRDRHLDEGAKLVAPTPLKVGRKVSLKLPLLEPLEGTIVWVSSRLAGCRFLSPLHPALLRVIVAAAQDQRQAG